MNILQRKLTKTYTALQTSAFSIFSGTTGQQLHVLTPFLTSILGFIIAGEIPEPPTLVGGAIILFGILIFNFGGKIYEFLFHKKSAV